MKVDTWDTYFVREQNIGVDLSTPHESPLSNHPSGRNAKKSALSEQLNF